MLHNIDNLYDILFYVNPSQLTPTARLRKRIRNCWRLCPPPPLPSHTITARTCTCERNTSLASPHKENSEEEKTTTTKENSGQKARGDKVEFDTHGSDAFMLSFYRFECTWMHGRASTHLDEWVIHILFILYVELIFSSLLINKRFFVWWRPGLMNSKQHVLLNPVVRSSTISTTCLWPSA